MVITGWKSIAHELGVSVRTAQTLRVRAALPVGNLTARLVQARRDELEAWRARRCASLRDDAVDDGMRGVAGP